MIEILTFMAPAICMCIILVGICGYVGLHVVMREVIFIDIALAQIAALGASLGIFLGFDLKDPWIFFISLTLTLIAALLLSATRRLTKFVPQEAFIGILYASGAAAVILAGDRLPHGTEHVHDLMVGHILWVNWPEVGVYALIYLFLGLIYFLIHKRLIEISKNIKKENSANFHFLLWDFIFYALMGILVTFAVRVSWCFIGVRIFDCTGGHRCAFRKNIFRASGYWMDNRYSDKSCGKLSFLYIGFSHRRYGCCNPWNHLIIGLNFEKYTTKGARLVLFKFLELLIGKES